MAHFAQIDENNKVLQVIVVANEELMVDGVESETKGVQFCKTLLGENTNWVQTSYNGNTRKNFASIGYSYSLELDAFVPEKCHEEAVLNQETALWDCVNETHEIKEII